MRNRIKALAFSIAICFIITLAFGTLPEVEAKSGSYNKARWQDLGAMTDCDGDAINAAVICGGTTGIRVQGWNVFTFEIFYEYAAGTGYEFYVETCREGQTSTDCTDAADWYVVAIQYPSPGSLVLTPMKVTRAVTADDRLTWTITGNYLRLRLNAMVATGSPTSSDKITVNLRMGYMEDI